MQVSSSNGIETIVSSVDSNQKAEPGLSLRAALNSYETNFQVLVAVLRKQLTFFFCNQVGDNRRVLTLLKVAPNKFLTFHDQFFGNREKNLHLVLR